MTIARIHVPPSDSRNINIFHTYDLENADWVTHPDCRGERSRLHEFVNLFELAADCELVVHVSADQRYELSLDGEFFAAGPDRCDINHWSFSSWKLTLQAGKHEFRALQWHLEEGGSPEAQLSLKSGFIFACSTPGYAQTLNTGIGAWRVREIKGFQFCSLSGVICRTPVFHGREFLLPASWVTPVVTCARIKTNPFGCIRRGWRLYPSELPEQYRFEHLRDFGSVRAVCDSYDDSFRHVFSRPEMDSPEKAQWQALINEGVPVEVPPDTERTILIDLGNYYCGYSLLSARGGDTEQVRFCWAESLYQPGTKKKGNRSEIEGKEFPSCCDSEIFCDFSETAHVWRGFWWRAGRYIQLMIRTGKRPLVIDSIGFRETRYPLENKGYISFSETKFNRPVPIMARSMQMCSHETFMDCPFYEQLMYVGDSRLEALTFFMMDPGMELPLRSVSLFDWSRSSSAEGLVGERYPSREAQLSSTFTMIWTYMVLDLLKYRRIPAIRASHLRNGVRAVVDALGEYLNSNGLLEHLPGWSFMDWVPEWPNGISMEGRSGAAVCTFQTHYLLALKCAMELEDAPGGSAHRKREFAERFESLGNAILKTYWDEERGMLANDAAHTNYCEHAQAVALICGILPPCKADRCFEALLTAKDLARTSIYYSFYLFEAFYARGCAERIADRMSPWNDSMDNGAVTTWERFGDTRSDCHAWGAHPLFHYYSSLAGIRPADFGFTKVSVAPQMGTIRSADGVMPHPDGGISFHFRNDPSLFTADITLPDGLFGEFVLRGNTIPLVPGRNHLTVE